MSGTSTFVFDFTTSSWSGRPNNRPYIGDHYSAVVVGTRIFVVGGFNGAASTVQIYDTVAETWASGPNLPWAAHGSVNAVLLRGEIHACGGLVEGSPNVSTTNNPEDCFRLNPTTLQWTRFHSEGDEFRGVWFKLLNPEDSCRSILRVHIERKSER